MSRGNSLEATRSTDGIHQRTSGEETFSYLAISGGGDHQHHAATVSPAFSATPSTPHYEIFANFTAPNLSSMKYRSVHPKMMLIILISINCMSHHLDPLT